MNARISAFLLLTGAIACQVPVTRDDVPSELAPQTAATAQELSTPPVAQHWLDEMSGLRGVEDAAVVVTFVTTDLAKSWLPGGLELGAATGVPSGLYPVLAIFNTHTGFADSLDTTSAGMTYNEFIVLLPDVYFSQALQKTRGAPKEGFNYMPTLQLDRAVPIAAGYFLGFAKHLSTISATRDTYTVQTRDGWELASAKFTAEGDYRSPVDFPNFMAAVQSFSPRYVGFQPELGFVCSETSIDFAQLKVQALRAEVTLRQALLPGLVLPTITSESIATNPVGAYRMNVPWTWTAGRSCLR
jgi:Acetoacetate decarboxylase (ADC)